MSMLDVTQSLYLTVYSNVSRKLNFLQSVQFINPEPFDKCRSSTFNTLFSEIFCCIILANAKYISGIFIVLEDSNRSLEFLQVSNPVKRLRNTHPVFVLPFTSIHPFSFLQEAAHIFLAMYSSELLPILLSDTF